MRPALINWLRVVVGRSDEKQALERVLKIANAARLSIDLDSNIYRIPGLYGDRAIEELINICKEDEDVFLDVIDAALSICKKGSAGKLDTILMVGGSVWRVAKSGFELQQRIEPTVAQAADAAMAPQDIASEELREAWAAAYGRNPDASDAWDHAIKAVESIYIPIVVANDNKATMGHVVGRLDSVGHLFNFVLSDQDDSYSVVVLVEMMRRIWPNPDRHSGKNRRIPKLEEAQAVVHLAITLVQWGRSGALASN